MRPLLFPILFFLGLPLIAQDYSHDLTGITKVLITVEVDIEVYAHEQSNFLIPEAENKKRKRAKEAEGLTALSSRGQDNTNYSVEVKQEGSKLFVTGLRDRLAPDLVVYLPSDMNLSVEIVRNNDILVEGFRSEIEAINQVGDIILKDVTGPVVTENRNGNTIVNFTEVDQSSPSALVASHGDLIVRLPPTAAVNISSKTPRGEFLTDFEVDLTRNQGIKYQNNGISGTINGGGVNLTLQSISGNIYLRKQN